MTKGKLPNPLRWSIDRFTSDPASIRNATLLMIAVTILIVLVGGVIIRVFDADEFPDYGSALWYTLQTVTTVGYGDKVPAAPVGRAVGAFVMVVAVALIAIITALITSTFVEAAQRQRRESQLARDQDSAKALKDRLDEIATRLAAIELAVGASEPGRSPGAPSEPPVPPAEPTG